MILRPRIRGFICLTTHPDGCRAHVREQIAYVKAKGPVANLPKRVLVIGASTGYGLAARIATTFGGGASTLGVFFAKPPSEDRTATAGWYNTVAFEREAAAAGYDAKDIHGDAYSDETKQRVVEQIRKSWGQVDLVVYSLASPKRNNPRTGKAPNSCLKPIGAPYTAKTVNTDKQEVHDITLPEASEQDIADTVSVMGGEDWEWWIDALEQGGVLAPGATTLAFSYIGPKLTFPIYRHGTIGRAKEDLEATALRLNERLAKTNGGARVVISKALVTQASSAIPVVPLYISLLYKVMKEKGLHEGCIEQMYRLFSTTPAPDAEGRLRIDDWEMRPDIQAEVEALWPQVATGNLKEISDFAGYQKEFLRLFGYGLAEVDYEAESDAMKMGGEPAVLL
ncbi:enoyl-[acyl-carrier protein] reductase / trans-2-enoyl-CoA reductase (NAD+) [Verrucomicrobium sp. GAS474]|uniref:enoyl-ACP reductase FabV n=1 Tax=Verrucomicrobium sp. GAS474 TaxID=1882831 RepID=UPI00087BD6AA|nr:enoyl-ACP reductase FabV [Verrucomicrobium sp. GAS474]SDT98519.1 enoyl-[acyl-carrier protein] reductase / trans-2-enoyl-CoA reductase (NAD+) [Verrucomicrobium sp. GAS474]